MKREDAWRPGTPIREQPMRHSPVLPSHLIPRLFHHVHVHHVQQGCAYASPPSSPILHSSTHTLAV